MEAVINLKFDEEPKYGAMSSLFEPLCGTVARRPISTEGARKVGMKRKVADMQFDDSDRDRLKKKVRVGLPAQQWITIYNAHRPMKQRYHYNVANSRIEQHVNKGNDDGLFISSISCSTDLWALIMDAGTGFSAQIWNLSAQFLPKDWILEQWDDGYYITALSGSANGCAIVVMSLSLIHI